MIAAENKYWKRVEIHRDGEKNNLPTSSSPKKTQQAIILDDELPTDAKSGAQTVRQTRSPLTDLSTQ